jgi:hypothetical protein
MTSLVLSAWLVASMPYPTLISSQFPTWRYEIPFAPG